MKIAQWVLKILVTLLIVLPVYGLISWHVFRQPTFLSKGRDCFPTMIMDISQPPQSMPLEPITFQEQLFGESTECATW